jgi:hypothetical protein
VSRFAVQVQVLKLEWDDILKLLRKLLYAVDPDLRVQRLEVTTSCCRFAEEKIVSEQGMGELVPADRT